MSGENILDHFEGFDADSRIVTLRYFGQPTQAHLYAARLREAGIPCFVSNVNTMTALPLGHVGIGLQVKESDAAPAARVIARLDMQLRKAPEEYSFHEADLDDIEFQRQLTEGRQSYDRLYLLILFIVALIILRAFLRAAGLVDTWWDHI